MTGDHTRYARAPMRTSILAAVGCLILSGCASLSHGCRDAVSGQGPRADVHALDRAISSRDRATLEHLVAEDLVWVSGSGETGGKADFINALTDAALRISPFEPDNSLLYASDTLELWTGTNTLRGDANGVPFIDRHHFADLWACRGGRWVLVHVQVTRAPSPASN